ncbi:transposase [uncultured Chryseobacterium sp.]|uniref:integrase core domain-containing protein n=1 Tax=Chryseobacterium culicis TaxID=680127 RepID=UPI001D0BF2E8
MEFARPGKPSDNIFIESFNCSLRDECLSINCFLTLQDVQEKLNAWKLDYNDYRLHSSLTPNEFIEMLLKKQISLF